jgi:peptide chain release factor 2
MVELEKKVADPDLWKDSNEARKITKERKTVESVLTLWNTLNKNLEDSHVLLELALEEDDDELEAELKLTAGQLEKIVNELEFKRMLGGENDYNDAIVSINAGAGGTEAQDWGKKRI